MAIIYQKFSSLLLFYIPSASYLYTSLMIGIPASGFAWTSQFCSKSLLHTLRKMSFLQPVWSCHSLAESPTKNPHYTQFEVQSPNKTIHILSSGYDSTLAAATRLSKHHKYDTQSLYFLYSAQFSIPIAAKPFRPQGRHSNPLRSLYFLTMWSLWFFQTFVRCCFHFPSSAMEFQWIHPLPPSSSVTSSRSFRDALFSSSLPSLGKT